MYLVCVEVCFLECVLQKVLESSCFTVFQKADPLNDPKFNRVKEKVLGQNPEDTYMEWTNLAGFMLEKPQRAVLWFSNDIKNYIVDGKYRVVVEQSFFLL